MAKPSKKGIVWKVAEPHPVNAHELMIWFGKTKQPIMQQLYYFHKSALLVRRRRNTHPTWEIRRYKQKEYHYPDGKHKPKQKRRRKPTLFQYMPTHWAMRKFLELYPDAVYPLKKGDAVWFKCVLVRPERAKRSPKRVQIVLPVPIPFRER